jgi:hypothetical protein
LILYARYRRVARLASLLLFCPSSLDTTND